MLIKAYAHRRDAEHAAVGVFPLRLLFLFRMNGRRLEIEATELRIVGIENSDGNTNVRFHQKDTLKRFFERFEHRTHREVI